MHNLSAMMQRVKKRMEENGIDITPLTPEEMAKRNEEFRQKNIKQWQAYQDRIWRKDSLWSGNQPLKFTFDDWKPELQPDKQLAAKLGNQAFLIAEEMKKKDFNVVMYGKPGTGKTSLALAIAEKLAKDEKRKFVFISTMALSRLFSMMYTDDSARERLDRLFKKAAKTKLLIIDDFGTEGGQQKRSDGGMAYYKGVRNDLAGWLFDLANARWSEVDRGHIGSTIITTNNTSAELRQMYDAKTLSRLIPKTKDHTMNFIGLEDIRKE